MKNPLEINEALLKNLGAEKNSEGVYILELRGTEVSFWFDEFYTSEGEWLFGNGFMEEYVSTLDQVLSHLVDTGYELRKQEVREAKNRLRDLEQDDD